MVGAHRFVVSEDFYSVQGEGISQGVPSYFIRLTGCNLNCGGAGGKWEAEGRATWNCDTETVWRSGRPEDFDALTKRILTAVPKERLNDHTVHLVWTGGEPTLIPHQISIANYMERLMQSDVFPYNEIETNATNTITTRLWQYIHQINASPKLSNSGHDEKHRIKPEVIKQINSHPNHQYKFVVSTEDDVQEAIKDFIIPYGIDPGRVVLMPGVERLSDLSERTRFVFNMAKKYHLRAVTRQHILAWDRVTGV